MLTEIESWEGPRPFHSHHPGFGDSAGRRRIEPYRRGVRIGVPHGFTYCLSKTKVEVNALPSALVPLVVVVMLLPPFEITVRPVA